MNIADKIKTGIKYVCVSAAITCSTGCAMLSYTIPAELVWKSEPHITEWSASYAADVEINDATARIMRISFGKDALEEYERLKKGKIEFKSLHNTGQILSATDPMLVEKIYNVGR